MMRIIRILVLIIIAAKPECHSQFFQKRRYRDSLFPVDNRKELHARMNHKVKPRYISVIVGEDDIQITIVGNNENKLKVENCGISDVVSTRIINGHNANAAEYPWIVSIEWEDKIMGCAVTILNERWIISAAHCFKRRNGTEITLIPASAVAVKVGSNDITKGTKYSISKIIIHNRFDTDLMLNSDIALLKTHKAIRKQKLGNTNFVNSICLPKSMDEEPRSKSLVVIGWGKLSPKNDYGTKGLMEVTVPLISDKTCEGFYRYLISKETPKGFVIYDSQICALSKSKDACQGDSGGPAFEYVNGRAVLIGIVSYGYGCAEGYPGVYTQVSYFLDWIEQNMNYM